ncbi:acyltransferase family protein [Sphingomonas lycopersici]|nr:acyltransferase [Sphingomonas lycopersici]
MGARFVFLDGMRGIAAFAVMLMHSIAIMHWCSIKIAANPAVDFFFCLSGFVLSFSYDDRLRTMGPGRFMLKRVIRLYPMIFLATLMALAAAAVAGTWNADRWMQFGLGLLLVPTFATAAVFPLNPPVWSLFFEMAASLGFDIEARRLPLKLAAAGVVTGGLVLDVCILLAGHVGTFGFGGTSFWLGLLRVGYSFGLGVLIHRSGLHLRGPRLPRWILTIVLLVTLALSIESGISDAIVVVIVMPVLVWLGGRALSDPLDRFWEWAGRLSYPLYLVHWPVMIASATLLGGSAVAAFVAIVLAVAVAWLALVLFDEPLRAWLANRARRRRKGEALARQDL